MELRGTIKSWNDDKGFGFVTPQAGGPAVFVHISAMRGDRRPVAGDAVFYIASNDEQGRLRASHMRLQGLSLDQPRIRIKPKTSPEKPNKTRVRKRPRAEGAVPQHLVFKLLVFALLCAAPFIAALRLFTEFHWVWALVLYPSVSLVTVVFYGYDKQRAMAGEWRTPESRLHLLEFLGGWPGAFLAQQVYRHKTRKVDYQIVFWGIVLAHQAFWLDWLLFEGERVGWVIRLVLAFS